MFLVQADLYKFLVQVSSACVRGIRVGGIGPTLFQMSYRYLCLEEFVHKIFKCRIKEAKD